MTRAMYTGGNLVPVAVQQGSLEYYHRILQVNLAAHLARSDDPSAAILGFRPLGVGRGLQAGFLVSRSCLRCLLPSYHVLFFS